MHDLGSRNGTCLNGVWLHEATRVSSGDRLSFSGVDLRFNDGASTIAAEPVRLLTLDDRTADGESSPSPYSLSVTTRGDQAATPVATGPPPAGKVVLVDTFQDAQHGWLPSGPVMGGVLSYLNGEYQLLKTDTSNNIRNAGLPGVYTNSTIAVDMRVIDPVPTNTLLLVSCRRNGGYGYDGHVRPQFRTAALSRIEGDTSKPNYVVPPTHKAPSCAMHQFISS